MGSTATWGLVAAVFAASLVEFVEAFTIVLAIGTLRGWKSALAGAALAIVAVPAVRNLPRGATTP